MSNVAHWWPGSLEGRDVIELGPYEKTYRVAQPVTSIDMRAGQPDLIRFADGQVCRGWQAAADRGLVIPVVVTGHIFEDLPYPAGDLKSIYEVAK